MNLRPYKKDNDGKLIIPRPSKKDYYLNIAREVATRSTCIRRRYGAIIVKDDRIVSTGYNGAARNEWNCCEFGECERQRLGIPAGERYELCRSVHAEANAIINANPIDMVGATLYLASIEDAQPAPCMMCSRLIKNAQIKEVICK